jgi:hypothetical protein
MEKLTEELNNLEVRHTLQHNLTGHSRFCLGPTICPHTWLNHTPGVYGVSRFKKTNASPWW